MNEKSIKNKYSILVVIRWPVGGIRTFCRCVYNTFNPDRYNFTIMAPDIDDTKQLMSDLKKFNPSFIPITNQGLELYNILNLKIPIIKFLKGKYNLIHSHGITAGILSAIPAFVMNIPHIMTIHETLTEDQFQGIFGRFKKILLSLTMPLINTIHHVSQDAKNNILENISILQYFPKKHIVIHSGINTQPFMKADAINFRKELDLPDNAFLIGFMGRFMPEKGFHYLIEAIEILSKDKSPIRIPRVLAFGCGAFIREEQEVIQKKGLDKYFRFLPYTNKVASSLKGLDVLAIPSLREAFGLIAIEGMVAGVPIIGTNCIGLREVLKNTPSTVVPAINSAAIADALLKEMRNPTSALARNFIDTASEKFDISKTAVEIETHIINLMKSDN